MVVLGFTQACDQHKPPVPHVMYHRGLCHQICIFKERTWLSSVIRDVAENPIIKEASCFKSQVSGPWSNNWGFGGHQFPLLAHQRQPQHDHCLETERQRRKMSSSRRMEIQWEMSYVLFPLHCWNYHLQYVGKTPRQYIQHIHYQTGKMHVCLKWQVL